jgi:hypothetical protein
MQVFFVIFLSHQSNFGLRILVRRGSSVNLYLYDTFTTMPFYSKWRVGERVLASLGVLAAVVLLGRFMYFALKKRKRPIKQHYTSSPHHALVPISLLVAPAGEGGALCL